MEIRRVKRLYLSFPSFVGAFANYNYTAAFRIYDLPAMVSDELTLPEFPAGAS